MLCLYLPIYMLLQRKNQTNIIFSGLPRHIFLLFLFKFTLVLRKISITRLQILMTPGFVVIDNKFYENTFKTTVSELQKGSKMDGMLLYKRFYFIYVQLLVFNFLKASICCKKLSQKISLTSPIQDQKRQSQSLISC